MLVKTKDGWNDYGMTIKTLPELAAFCSNQLFNGVSFFAVLVCCYRGLTLHWSDGSLGTSRLDKAIFDDKDKVAVNVAAQNLLRAIGSDVVLTGESGIEVMDMYMTGYKRGKSLGKGSYGMLYSSSRWSSVRNQDAIGTMAQADRVGPCSRRSESPSR